MTLSRYLALRDLLATKAYAEMDADAAEEALNAPTVAAAGSPLMTPDAFVGRFTPDEFAACADSRDPLVRQLMFTLSTRRDPLDVTGVTVTNGLAYMASLKVLTAARVAEIAAVPPGPLVTPREALGWPGPRIWAADVIAARAMKE